MATAPPAIDRVVADPIAAAAAVGGAVAESIGAALDAGTLPEGCSGSMDGVRPPANKVEQIQKALEPYQKKYGHYLSKVRPWRDFFWPLSKPEGDVKARLEANLTHFQINYAVVFLVQMVLAIVLNPRCLVIMALLAAVWVGFLKKNDDPSWQVKIVGVDLSKTHRWMALSAVTAIVLLSVVGQMLFSTAFFCALMVVAHGVLHPVPDSLEVPGLTVDSTNELENAPMV